MTTDQNSRTLTIQKSYLLQLRSIKSEKDEVEARYQLARTETMLAMEEAGDVRWSDPSTGQAAIVVNTKLSVDEVGLLAKLTPKQAKAITVTSIDHGKLESAVELGLIEAELVAGYVTEQQGKPYLRFTG